MNITRRLRGSIRGFLIGSLMIGALPLSPCTPTQVDQNGSIEIWCCCSSSYQRCASFLEVAGASNGKYIGEMSRHETAAACSEMLP